MDENETVVEITIRVPKDRMEGYVEEVSRQISLGYEGGYVDSDIWWEQKEVEDED